MSDRLTGYTPDVEESHPGLGPSTVLGVVSLGAQEPHMLPGGLWVYKSSARCMQPRASKKAREPQHGPPQPSFAEGLGDRRMGDCFTTHLCRT